MKPVFTDCNVCGRELIRDDELAIGCCAVCSNEEIEMTTPQSLTDEQMPGAWICDKCGFTLQKNVLHTGDASISADTSPLNESCPNDGKLMRPLTWRETNEEFYKRHIEDAQKLTALEKRQLESEAIILRLRWIAGKASDGPNNNDNERAKWYCERDKLYSDSYGPSALRALLEPVVELLDRVDEWCCSEDPCFEIDGDKVREIRTALKSAMGTNEEKP